MSNRTLIELFGHIVFSFTRGMAVHYNPQEHEFRAESFGYLPLQRTGLEWDYQPVDEFIYKEYSDREVTTSDPLTVSRHQVLVINACSPDEIEEKQESGQDEDSAMSWKQLRPSALCTVLKSMYTGASISLLTAAIIGLLYMSISYLCYKTAHNCEFYPHKIPVSVQWVRTLSTLISCAFLYMWNFARMLFLFRPYQLLGVKGKLVLVSILVYFLDALYRVALQALGISNSRLSVFLKIPLNTLFLISICLQVYFLTKHLCFRSRRLRVSLFLQMIMPGCFCFVFAIVIAAFIYPLFNKQNEDEKLLIAVFTPLTGVALKVISRIYVQRSWNITHPGYSYVLLSPLYLGTAVMLRVLQADLKSLQSMAILGIIHGAAEVIERSTMVVIDHVCHVILKRKLAPWGSFRTPRQERLMADLSITSMLYESTAIVSVNGFLYLYKFVYLENVSVLELLQSFTVRTSVQLVIEWFFTSVSLAIVTHYQNMAVMAVWRKRWKRHTLVAIVNAVPLAMWTSTNLLIIVHGRFQESSYQPCKMPFI